MTHIEITNEFVRLNLQEGDLVYLTLSDNSTLTGRLSYGKVGVNIDDDGNYIESSSRIGLLPPPPPPGRIAPGIINTVYSQHILSISLEP
ncbi:hypothetical protein DSECCO2_577840 [anaerobic digester metagenome]